MAITKAQQARQMLIKGGVVHSDGRRGFFQGALRDASRGRGNISPGTDREGNQRPGGSGNPRRGGAGPFSKPTMPKAPPGQDPNKPFKPFTPSTKPKDKPDIIQPKPKPTTTFLGQTYVVGSPELKDAIKQEERRKEIEQRRKEKIEKSRKFKTFEEKTLKDLIRDEEEEDKDVKPGFFDKLKGSIRNFTPPSVALLEGITGLIPGKKLSDMYIDYGDDYKTFDDYERDVLAGKISTKGTPMGGRFRDSQGNLLGGREGPDNQIIPQVVPTTTAPITPTTTATTSEDESVDDIFGGGLAARFGGSLFDFDNLRENAMDGGIMNTDIIGGFADDSMDEMGRQMYGLGKLVKKVTKSVKKIVKSPIGKAAILGAVGFGIPGVKTGFFSKGLMGTKTGIGLKNLIMGKPLGFKTAGDAVARTGGLLDFFKSPMGLITGSSILAGALTPKQKQELLQQQEEEDDFDLIASRDNPFKVLAPRFEGSQFVADGGRIGYQEGGDAEPVAKKTMPLIDMNGMEKDYRETGGFVEMGRMERADDVPARLSKNEFVFTADAVRNAGDGNIDKGAEVMYNMMKNLEAGGEVSEESQGLEGARKMFQTSQRLGEVI
jgi:hypothetical protein